MLIQTDGAIHVVEVKRRERIGEDVIDEVKEKIRRLREVMRLAQEASGFDDQSNSAACDTLPVRL